MKIHRFAAAAAVIATVIATQPAAAHARLKTAQPAVGSTVAAAPKSVELEFSEGVVPRFFRRRRCQCRRENRLRRQGGERHRGGQPRGAARRNACAGRLYRDLARGLGRHPPHARPFPLHGRPVERACMSPSSSPAPCSSGRWRSFSAVAAWPFCWATFRVHGHALLRGAAVGAAASGLAWLGLTLVGLTNDVGSLWTGGDWAGFLEAPFGPPWAVRVVLFAGCAIVASWPRPMAASVVGCGLALDQAWLGHAAAAATGATEVAMIASYWVHVLAAFAWVRRADDAVPPASRQQRDAARRPVPVLDGRRRNRRRDPGERLSERDVPPHRGSRRVRHDLRPPGRAQVPAVRLDGRSGRVEPFAPRTTGCAASTAWSRSWVGDSFGTCDPRGRRRAWRRRAAGLGRRFVDAQPDTPPTDKGRHRGCGAIAFTRSQTCAAPSRSSTATGFSSIRK